MTVISSCDDLTGWVTNPDATGAVLVNDLVDKVEGVASLRLDCDPTKWVGQMRFTPPAPLDFSQEPLFMLNAKVSEIYQWTLMVRLYSGTAYRQWSFEGVIQPGGMWYNLSFDVNEGWESESGIFDPSAVTAIWILYRYVAAPGKQFWIDAVEKRSQLPTGFLTVEASYAGTPVAAEVLIVETGQRFTTPIPPIELSVGTYLVTCFYASDVRSQRVQIVEAQTTPITFNFPPPPPHYSDLRIEGRWMKDSAGKVIQPTGVWLAGITSNPVGVWGRWKYCDWNVVDKMFEKIKSWGVKFVAISVCVEYWLKNMTGNTSDGVMGHREVLKRVIEKAGQHGLYIIIRPYNVVDYGKNDPLPFPPHQSEPRAIEIIPDKLPLHFVPLNVRFFVI